MSNMAEIYREWHKIRKDKKMDNLSKSKAILEEENIEFSEHNMGSHFVIYINEAREFDFWPTTGKFWHKGRGIRGTGVFNLIKQIDKIKDIG